MSKKNALTPILYKYAVKTMREKCANITWCLSFVTIVLTLISTHALAAFENNLNNLNNLDGASAENLSNKEAPTMSPRAIEPALFTLTPSTITTFPTANTLSADRQLNSNVKPELKTETNQRDSSKNSKNSATLTLNTANYSNNHDDLPKNTLIHLNKNNFGGRINSSINNNALLTKITTLNTAHNNLNPAVTVNTTNSTLIQLTPKTSSLLANTQSPPLLTNDEKNNSLLSQGIQNIHALSDKMSDAGQGLISSIQKVSEGIGQGLGQIGQTGLKIVAGATQLIGIPYRFGGNSPSTGLDCSGFVRYVYQSATGLILPRQSAQMSQVGKIIPRDNLNIGDLVFFNTRGHAYSHVGIYVGGGRFIHSPSTGKTIRIDALENSYWAQRYNGARRLI